MILCCDDNDDDGKIMRREISIGWHWEYEYNIMMNTVQREHS